MQKVMYMCDGCKKQIGEKKHLSVVFGQNGVSGVAMLPKDQNRWSVTGFPQHWVHFHNGTCAGKYFDNLLNTVVEK